MMQEHIDHLILNPPYEEPREYWRRHQKTKSFSREAGRRPAGYLKATPRFKGTDDPGIFVPIPLVDNIRKRVNAWREAGYPGVSGITKRLLEHWNGHEQRSGPRFFFCQLEAIETLIWFTETPESERVGLKVPPDGGEFRRLCAKMATGTGKTVVMAMAIAWHVLNKVASPQDKRFSKNIFVVAPGLTVKNRLSVLHPSDSSNYYKEFDIVPSELMDKMRQGMVRICNWHTLNWDTEEKIQKKKGVDKRGVMSDEAYVRGVLGDMAKARNVLVINDEAHHAWRVNPGAKHKGGKDSVEEATIWVGGLDRIHKARGILVCYDFSATPFTPSGKQSAEEDLFGWIVSDFSLSDAIESGLVKTPRVVVRDDALPDSQTYKSRLYHIYNDSEVKDDFNRSATPETPLPDIVRTAYHLLGYDWQKAKEQWEQEKAPTPPVMITVANRTETAARINYALQKKKIQIDALCVPERILHIDSKVLATAEAMEETIPVNGAGGGAEEPDQKRTQKGKAEFLRKQVDTVGKPGEPGERIQKVISVGMLSEGWDAKTVTHIMGLRAFTSQLLCEQVVGRGLRRLSYDLNKNGMLDPEYVNIFGVPFTFLPHEENDDLPLPPVPKTAIEPVADKREFEITWPNVARIDYSYLPKLSVDWQKVASLTLKAEDTPRLAELAPTVAGKADVTKIETVDIESLAGTLRMQRLVFEAAQSVYEQMQHAWKGGRESLIAQVIGLADEFIRSHLIQIEPKAFHDDALRRRLMITLNMTKVVQHFQNAIRFENVDRAELVFDRDKPIRSTGDMRTWYTSRPCEHTERSHVNFCVYDSTWEASESFELDRNPAVDAWVKNDHLGFEILYTHKGIVKKYRPDFIIRLRSGDFLVLETKGQETEQDKTKRRFLDEWTRAVNEDGRFGRWRCDVSTSPSDLKDVLLRHV